MRELLTHASCWEERWFPNTSLTAVPEQPSVSWQRWPSTCRHGTAFSGWWALPHSSEAQQEPPLGSPWVSGFESSTMLSLHEGTSPDMLQGPPEILMWRCWYVLLPCQLSPVALVTLVPLTPVLGMLTSSPAAAWQGNTGLWNSNLSSGQCSQVADSLFLVQHLIGGEFSLAQGALSGK